MKFTVVVCAVAATVALAGSVALSPADAVGTGHAQSTLLADVPGTNTPNVVDGTVFAITRIGSEIILGGNFTGVQNPGSSTTLARSDVLAFDSATGTVSTSFAPTLDGMVEALAPGPTAGTVYVGGWFKNVNGVSHKAVVLLDATTGVPVPSFTPPYLNGAVFTLAQGAGRLLVGGSFYTAGNVARAGLASLDPNTGALDNYLTVALAGHHNYDGTTNTAYGPVGARAMSIDPAGDKMVVVGDFKTADNLSRDQIAIIDLNGTSATVDAWATLHYTAACKVMMDDTYVTDVQYSPDGSYFVTTATGGSGTNLDGSRGLCDAAARWNSADTGTDVAPAWVDYTGGDTFWSVAVTGVAVYVGGHQRWVNNSLNADGPGGGRVPRPGLAALDPVNGLPLAWNPGRNPRGAGTYALFADDTGLYVGSDTDYFGNWRYLRRKIGFFPLVSTVPASTAVNTLPADVYLAGPLSTTTGAADSLVFRPLSGTGVGATTAAPNGGVAWGSTRAIFLVGGTLFWGGADGNLHKAPFNGTVGAATLVDPYNDPAWCSVQTGSGQTYCGKRSGFFGQLPAVTGAFYSAGRLYYTLTHKSALYWRWFSPDSGVIGSDQFTVTTADFSGVNGMFASGSTLYWADRIDGALRSMSFVGGVPDPSTTAVVSGPAIDGPDWRSRSMFLD